MATNDPKKLSPSTTHWHNRSLSSVNSDAGTFHSAHAHNGSHIELETQAPISSKPLPKPQQQQPPPPQQEQQKQKPYNIQESRLESIKMDRTDSGYEDGNGGRSSTEGKKRERSSSRPQSTSSRTKKERYTSPRTSTSGTRPAQRRNRRSSPPQTSQSSTNNNSDGPRKSTSEWRAGAPRPSLHARHTTPYTRSTISAQYPAQYFHFPPISDPTSSHSNDHPNNEPEAPISPHTPPPATVQYWTSDSTRRLEYAAIDAASKGVRGFVIKMIPDCFLPSKAKRRRFHDDDASDAGSVRRYRLNLPEENQDKELQDIRVKEGGRGRPGILRRWTTFGYGRASGGKKKNS